MTTRFSTLTYILVACTIASSAFAQQTPSPSGGQHGPNPEKFQEMKSRMVDHLQKRIQVLQQAQSCVQAATAPDQLKKCHQQEHQAMEQMHEQHEHENRH